MPSGPFATIISDAGRERLYCVYTATLLKKMCALGRAKCRRKARRDIEELLELVAALDVRPCVTPIATRAGLVMLRVELEPDASLPDVYDYLGGIVRDEPPARLEELVMATLSIELMLRFERYMPPAHRPRVRDMRIATEVMTS